MNPASPAKQSSATGRPATSGAGPGLILSGGGARGAYEAGVLHYLFTDFAKRHGVPRFSVVCGTSVGAFNGAAIAAYADQPQVAGLQLQRIWSSLRLADVVRFGVRQAANLPRVLLGGAAAPGVFDARPLARLVRRAIPWSRVSHNIRSGRLRALTVTATRVATGRPVVFVDHADGAEPATLPANIVWRRGHILPAHVLASAAIPVLFPPIQIGTDLYCDGGLRLNTPMSPALHLGVERVLVIGVASPPAVVGAPALPPGRFPGATFLIGKVLNAFLLDHIHGDLEDLARVNALLEDVRRLGGDQLLEQLHEEAIRQGHPPRRIVRSEVIRPSVDLGRLASEHLREHQRSFRQSIGRSFLRVLDVGEGADSDLASYLMFDGPFAKKLMDLGHSDAQAREEELAAFMQDHS